jgi:ribosomal protein S14
MKKKTVIDNYKRNLYYFGESFKVVRKLCYANLTSVKTFKLVLKGNVNLRRVSLIKTVNRCFLTGRKVNSGGFLKLSRLEFLRTARMSALPGVKKRTR